MLKVLNPNSITNKKGVLDYTLLDSPQKTTVMMSGIDNIAPMEYVEASNWENNKDLLDCSTEPYLYSVTEINSRNKLSDKLISKTN